MVSIESKKTFFKNCFVRKYCSDYLFAKWELFFGITIKDWSQAIIFIRIGLTYFGKYKERVKQRLTKFFAFYEEISM